MEDGVASEAASEALVGRVRSALSAIDADVDARCQALARVPGGGFFLRTTPFRVAEWCCDLEIDACCGVSLLGRELSLRALGVRCSRAHRLGAYGTGVNKHWGYMCRARFSDKSHLMRQIEKYADIYTSRVSNLLRCERTSNVLNYVPVLFCSSRRKPSGWSYRA